MAKGNRQTFTSNVTSKIQPKVTTAIHRDMLINDLAASVVFGQDVAIPQSSAISNITVDFTGKDRVDLTRTGGSLNITVTGIDDGETKFLLITKTSGQAVTFVGVTDVTPVKQNANALNLVLYEIVRKSSYYFAKAWVENVKTATEDIEGVLETATSAEANALSVINKIITPGRIPIASTSQRGVVEHATSAENDAGTAGNLVVTAAEMKRKYDAALAYAYGLNTAMDVRTDNLEAKFAGIRVRLQATVTESGTASKTKGDLTISAARTATGRYRMTFTPSIAAGEYLVIAHTITALGASLASHIAAIAYDAGIFEINIWDDNSSDDCAFGFTLLDFVSL